VAVVSTHLHTNNT